MADEPGMWSARRLGRGEEILGLIATGLEKNRLPLPFSPRGAVSSTETAN